MLAVCIDTRLHRLAKHTQLLGCFDPLRPDTPAGEAALSLSFRSADLKPTCRKVARAIMWTFVTVDPPINESFRSYRAIALARLHPFTGEGPVMAKPARRRIRRKVVRTDEFTRWSRNLDPERKARVAGAITRIVERGPTLGRPHVDVVHGSRLHKLKEARIDRGTRVLFAFDSNQNAVMLLGGDKTGKWNRWYPNKIRQAERLYSDHERSVGKDGRWLSRSDAGRIEAARSR